MIIEKTINIGNVDANMRRLYETAFPTEEQIPWDDLLHLIDSMNLDFTAYYVDGDFVGLTIVCPCKKYNWIWYFAVCEHLRGKGIGQQILTLLLKRYSSRSNILDIESPEQTCDNPQQRRRRYDFYLRNGFRDTHVGRTFQGITYTILMSGEDSFTQLDYDDIIAELRSFWSPK